MNRVHPHKETSTPVSWEKLAAPQEKRQGLIESLHQDLGREYQAVLMYLYFAAKLMGPTRGELRALFQAQAVDEQHYAQFLFKRLHGMCGKPVTRLGRHGPVPCLTQPAQMIECALRMKTQAITDDTARISQAKEYAEVGLTAELEAQLAHRIRHKEAFERMTDAWLDRNLELAQNDERGQGIGGTG
jgi:bacterioferritin (cytochrome b1)